MEAREELRAQGKQGFASLWEFCETSRPAPAEQAGARVADQGRRDGWLRAARAGLCRAGQGDGARAEVAEGCRGRPDGLFGGIFDADDTPAANRESEALPPAPDWDEHTRLQNEKEVLGFFVSGHPLDKYREKLRNLKVVDTATACEMKPEPQVFGGARMSNQNEIQIAGVITGLKVAKSKRSGEMYAQAIARRRGGQDRADCLRPPTRSWRRS
jgi:DNA polymerase-3 subunit alpha